MFKFLFFFSIFALLIIGIVYLIFRSPFFQAAVIEVSGSERGEEIKQELIPVLAGGSVFQVWLGPENLLFWSPGFAKTMPASLYWLSSLTLQRDWLDKKILIEVEEREPWLVWCLSETPRPENKKQTDDQIEPQKDESGEIKPITKTQCYRSDASGVIFGFALEAQGLIIPKVFEESGRQLLFGQSLFNDSQLTQNALAIIKQLQNSSLAVLRFSIKELNLQELEAETSGPKLYFSLRAFPKELNKLLDNLSRHLDFQKLQYIDFRVENRIYYK